MRRALVLRAGRSRHVEPSRLRARSCAGEPAAAAGASQPPPPSGRTSALSNWLFLEALGGIERVGAHNSSGSCAASAARGPVAASPQLHQHAALPCVNRYPRVWAAHACGVACFRDVWGGLATGAEARALVLAAECRVASAALGPAQRRSSGALGECDDAAAAAPVLRRMAGVLASHYGVVHPTLSHRRA